MLTLSNVKDASYYTQLSKANHGVEYYFIKEVNKIFSFWHGKLAQELKLVGKTVDKKDMLMVLQSANTKTRPKQVRLGLDMTFSAPKSVSLAYMLLGDTQILKAHLNAVKKTLDYIEEYLVLTRHKKKREKATGTAIACFTHFVSRDLDPQLHTHCVLINAVKRKDGAIASLENVLIFKHRADITRLYHANLAEELRRIGYEVKVREEGYVEIEGFSRELIESFSTATKKTEEKFKELLKQNPRAKWVKLLKKARLLTRQKKKDIDLHNLQKVWRNKLNQQGGVRIEKKQVKLRKSNKEWLETWLREKFDKVLASQQGRAFTFQRLALRLKQELVKDAITHGFEVPEDFDELLKDHFVNALMENKIRLGDRLGYFVVNTSQEPKPEPKPEKKVEEELRTIEEEPKVKKEKKPKPKFFEPPPMQEEGPMPDEDQDLFLGPSL